MAQHRQTLNSDRVQAWQEVVDEAHIHCLRLSWDSDEHNRAAIQKKIIDRFGQRLFNFAATGASGLAEFTERQVGDQESCANYLKQVFGPRLEAIRDAGQGSVSRAALYRALVVADRSSLSQTVIAEDKPFAREIKQAIDLIYNTNITDAIGISPLTPAGSADRPTLSESGGVAAQVSANEIAALIASINAVLGSHAVIDRHLELLDILTIDDVDEIRSSASWVEYVDAAEKIALAPTTHNGKELVEEMSARIASASAAAERLGSEIVKVYGEAYPTSSKPASSAFRLAASIGNGKIVAAGIGAVLTSIGAALGGAHGAALGAMSTGVVSDFAREATDTIVGEKARQQIDLVAASGVSALAAWKLPRLEFGDHKETAADVMELLASHYGMRGKQAAVLPNFLASEGHCSALEAPTYG